MADDKYLMAGQPERCQSLLEVGDTMVREVSGAFDSLRLLFDPVSISIVGELRAGRDPYLTSPFADEEIAAHVDALISLGVLQGANHAHTLSRDGVMATLNEIKTVLRGAAQ